jgi:hypothetical protein
VEVAAVVGCTVPHPEGGQRGEGPVEAAYPLETDHRAGVAVVSVLVVERGGGWATGTGGGGTAREIRQASLGGTHRSIIARNHCLRVGLHALRRPWRKFRAKATSQVVGILGASTT